MWAPLPLSSNIALQARSLATSARPWAWCAAARLGQAQQRACAGAQTQPAHQPRTSFPAEGEAVGEQELGEAQRPSGPGSSHRGQTFRENLTRARGMVTEKLAHPQLHAHDVGAPGQIGEGACLPAVDPRGPYVAERAGGTGWGRGHVERNRGSRIIDVPRLQG